MTPTRPVSRRPAVRPAPDRSAAGLPPGANPAHLTVAEIARHLRLGTRSVYDLVARKGMPHRRAGAKLLFSVDEVEAWMAARTGNAAPAAMPPAVIGGSHDPLLEWAVRESRAGLALLTQGSTDGLERLAGGEVCAALVHLPDADLADFNREAARDRLAGRHCALVEWAKREQGLLVARGNPKGIRRLADLAKRGVRVAARQVGAGSAVLLERLLAREGIDPGRLRFGAPVMGEGDLATSIRAGESDAGLGARSAAALAGLDFVPLAVERLDLAFSRAAWFEPHLQALFAFARGKRLAEKARSLGGYDVSALGAVTWNDPLP